MAKYKLLTNNSFLYPDFKAGEIYDKSASNRYGDTVGELRSSFPYHWQLIEEKRPIMTYIILLVMMALYLYAGLWQINWPLIPATIMGFYLLIKIERNGRKQVL